MTGNLGGLLPLISSCFKPKYYATSYFDMHPLLSVLSRFRMFLSIILTSFNESSFCDESEPEHVSFVNVNYIPQTQMNFQFSILLKNILHTSSEKLT